MVQQNQKTTKKGRGGRVEEVRKNTLPITRKKAATKKPVENKSTKAATPDVAPSKNTDEHIITEFGQKVKILNDISTVDGTLYKDEIAKVESAGGIVGKDLKIVDTLGRVWYVNFSDVSTKV